MQEHRACKETLVLLELPELRERGEAVGYLVLKELRVPWEWQDLLA